MHYNGIKTKSHQQLKSRVKGSERPLWHVPCVRVKGTARPLWHVPYDMSPLPGLKGRHVPYGTSLITSRID